MSENIAALPFEAAEYERRVAGARARMAERGLDLLIVTGAENGYYLSGLLVGTPQVFLALVLPIEGDACWVVRQTELSNVRTMSATSWVKEGVGVPDEADPIEILAGHLRERGAERARIGVERQGWFFHTDYQHRLAAALADATFLDSTGIVEGMRNVKGAAEIAYMKRAGAVTAAALRAGIEAVAEGVTDQEIGAILTATAIREGSGPMPQGPFVTCGARSFMAHSTWAGAPIRAGELVNTEMACRALLRALLPGLGGGPALGRGEALPRRLGSRPRRCADPRARGHDLGRGRRGRARTDSARRLRRIFRRPRRLRHRPFLRPVLERGPPHEYAPGRRSRARARHVLPRGPGPLQGGLRRRLLLHARGGD